MSMVELLLKQKSQVLKLIEWYAKELERKLAALLKGPQMVGFCFEIMKNCSEMIVAPNIPSGRRIDSKLLLKSIAPSKCIYI